MSTCPNDTDNDGNCSLCSRLSSGCFMRDTISTPSDLEQARTAYDAAYAALEAASTHEDESGEPVPDHLIIAHRRAKWDLHHLEVRRLRQQLHDDGHHRPRIRYAPPSHLITHAY